MSSYTTISASNIPEILNSFEYVQRSLVKIDEYACKDFRSTKQILDILKDLDIDQVLSDPARIKLSEIVSDLQYVDVLQQRLLHIKQTTDFLKGGLRAPSNHVVAYRPLVKLNLNQFQDAINLYLNTTDAVHTALTEISKNHRMLFLHIQEIKSLYRYNTEILREVANVREIYQLRLLKYQYSNILATDDCIQQVKTVAKYYTMQQERVILDAFLKVEMQHGEGYDVDSDKEQISFF